MIVLDLSILNQKGTPMFNSDIFANRPAFGIVGRIFISTDTKEFYRDTGTSWELIGGPGAGTITGSGTTGTLAKFTGTSSIGNSIVSETGSALNINGTAKANNYYVGTPTDTTRAFAAAGDANLIALWLEEYTSTGGGTPDIFLRNGRGTLSAKANIQSGDSLGGIAWAGYLGSTFSDSAAFSTTIVNIDSTNNHADVDFNFFQSYNSASLSNNLKIRALDGYVVAPNGGFETTGNINLFAGANTRRFVFDANAGIPRIFSFRTGNLPRWAFRVDGVESGSDTGADFAIRRYNDAGTFIDSPIFIVRSTGQTFVGPQTTASGKLVVNSATADNHLQIIGANSPSIRIDNAGSGGTQRFVFGLATATNNFIQGATAGEFCISTQSAGNMLFGMWQTTNASEVMRITTANNLVVGSSVDNGNRLQVNGGASASSFEVGNGQFYKARRNSSNLLIDLLGIEGGSDDTRLLITADFNIKAGSGATLFRFNQNASLGVNCNASNAKLEVVSTTGEVFRADGASGAPRIVAGQSTVYLGGNVTINSFSNPGQTLYLNGSMRIDGQSSGTAGVLSGQYLIINLDGTTYKIALFNP